MFDGDLFNASFYVSVHDEGDIPDLGKMELVVAEIIVNDLETALVKGEGLEEALSLEAEPAILFALGFSSSEGAEIGEEAITFVLKGLGVDIVQFWMLFFQSEKRVLYFIAIGLFLMLQVFEELVVDESALFQRPQELVLLLFGWVETEGVGAKHAEEEIFLFISRRLLPDE